MDLTRNQSDTLRHQPFGQVFISGPAGTGKTTTAIHYVLDLLNSGTAASEVLIFTPQREYQSPYLAALQQHPAVLGGLQTATLAGLSRRYLELYWPMVAKAAGFAQPTAPPVFLTMETAQYQMMSILQPFLDLGRFASLVIDRNRLSSQILDNLNKAALVGLDLGSIGSRLALAWAGDPAYLSVYDDAQWCIDQFREKCLRENLVDTSLQIELFTRYLWQIPLFREQLQAAYPHIIYDNCEEDAPTVHDIMLEWLPKTTSALVLFDEDAGYRKFLGADPISAARLANACTRQQRFTEPIRQHGTFLTFSVGLRKLLLDRKPVNLEKIEKDKLRQQVHFISTQYQPEMLTKTADRIQGLVSRGTPPDEIVVLAPFINDTLWFPLRELLRARGIPSSSSRPSRSLTSEPIINAMVTLARIAHPAWHMPPTVAEFIQALVQVIDGIDLVRAKLLAEVVYRANMKLSPFEAINPDMRNRIRQVNGQTYETLREWIEAYRSATPLPLDHFFRRLFGEILTQPGFSMRKSSPETGAINRLVESAYKFRHGLPADSEKDHLAAGRDYVEMLRNGIIAAAFVDASDPTTDSEFSNPGVTIMPAIAFLLSGRTAQAQFWMDAGSNGWFERIDQPLTHPYVLSRNWQQGAKWTDTEEYNANMQTMHGLLQGLLSRCEGQIFICTSQYNETGYEQKGPLVQAAQRLL